MVAERKVRLVQGVEGSPSFCFGLVDDDTGADVLFVQSDWDYPGLASRFGWSVKHVQKCDECAHVFTGPTVPAVMHCPECDHASDDAVCDHSGTDGTVDCHECGIKAGEFIASAFDWLDARDGEVIECDDYNGEG